MEKISRSHTSCAPWSAIEAMFNVRMDEIEALLDAAVDGDPDSPRLVERFDELVAMKWNIYDRLFEGMPCTRRA